MAKSALSLSEDFAAALAAPHRTPPASLVGLEHEYRVTRSGEQVDFRDLIHGLPVPGRRLDPGDINAYRLTSGLALTCDEAEAEVVSPPVAVEPGFTGAVEGWAATGREVLIELLPPAFGLEGYSTHLSVAMPDHLNDAASELYARTFAPALALMLERRDSQGMYVRPRPGRLELCGEYVEGARLGATAAFAAGSAAACARMVRGDVAAGAPPRLAVALLPGKERYGLRVLRDAYGSDLYREGRDSLLKLESGGTIGAQEVLELCWAAARASLQTSANHGDLDTADRMVSGALPLGVEGEPPAAAPRSARPQRWPPGDLLAVRPRPGFQIGPAVATWDFTVFRIEGARRVAFVNVPRAGLEPFLERLDAGRLDDLLAAYIDLAPRGRVLASRAEVESPGLYDSLGDPTDLLAEEREPAAWSGPGEAAPGAARQGKTPAGGSARRGKRPAGMGRPGKAVALPPLAVPSTRPVPAPAPPGAESAPQPTAPGRHIPWPPIAAAIALATVGLGFAAAIVFSNDTSGPVSETPTVVASTSPVPSAAPSLAPTDSTSPTATATSTPTATATPTPTKAPDVAGGALTPTPTPTSTPTVRPAETPPPTATRFATETPRPTSTPTPTSTATPTPPRTIPPPTVAPTVAAGCTPSGGVVCK